MESELVCNYKKCRKHLKTFAWRMFKEHVLAACDIFCDGDGTREFNKNYICPACENNLSGKYDIIRTDLQPTEQYKSMVLAGQNPETIMEICTRAISFWTYQSHQEQIYQDYLATKAKEKAVQLEQYYEQIISRTQQELSSVKTQLNSAKKEVENTKKKMNEVTDKLAEKNRQHQKLQGMYDIIRRKLITQTTVGGGGDTVKSTRSMINFNMSLQSGDDVLKRSSGGPGDFLSTANTAPSPCPKNLYPLRLSNTPVVGLGSNSGGFDPSHFNLSFGTPKP